MSKVEKKGREEEEEKNERLKGGKASQGKKVVKKVGKFNVAKTQIRARCCRVQTETRADDRWMIGG